MRSFVLCTQSFPMVFLSPPNSNGLALSTFQARTNPPDPSFSHIYYIIINISYFYLANYPTGLLNDFRLPRRPLMVRAALRRRSCDGVAAATESLLRRRCADQLRRAHSARRVAALNAEPASFPPGDSNFNSWPTVLGHPPGPVIF